MSTTQRVVKDLTILTVDGCLAADPDDAELATFRRAVDDLLTLGCTDLAIDVSQVAALDAEGLGELARTLGRISGRGGRFTLIAPPESVRRRLSTARLETMFHIVATADEVIGTPFGASRRR